jgi:hypothetical protein
LKTNPFLKQLSGYHINQHKKTVPLQTENAAPARNRTADETAQIVPDNLPPTGL